MQYFEQTFKLYYWPILSCTWCISTFILTYIISVSNGHVYPFFPYISDTGTRPPESCIFGQMLNIEAVLLAITVYLRYKQVKITILHCGNVIREFWNNSSLLFGWTACLGIAIVGNFQETNLLSVHLVGAVLTFGVGLFYFIIQTQITIAFRNIPIPIYRVKRWLVYFRMFLIVCLIPLFFVTSTFNYLSSQKFTGKSIEYWTEEDGGFVFRLIGTFTEWFSAIFMMIFIATYSVELRNVKFRSISFESVA